MTVRKKTLRNRVRRAAIVIAAGGLVLPAQALELGAANLRSALGERLLVEIPIRSELPLPAGCIDARVGPVGGMLRPTGLRQRTGGIVLSTPRIVSEPMLVLTVSLRCPSLPRLSRDYTLLLDPATRSGDRKPGVLDTANRPRPLAAARPAPAAATRRYRVRPGDTVSAIAAGLTPDGQSYWPMVDRIVAANPRAFAGGNPDRLLAGSVLSLPAPSAPAVARTNVPVAETTARARETSPPIVPTPETRAATSRRAVSATAPDHEQRTMASREGERTTTDRVLNVLNPAASGTSSPDSLLEATPRTAAAARADGDVGEIETTVGPDNAWTRKLVGLGAGMIIAIVGFATWRRLTRPMRQRAATVPSLRATGTNDPLAEMPLTIDMAEPRENVAATGVFESDESLIAASPAAHRRAEDDIEVGALGTIHPTDTVSELDDETRQILEADYEAEFTRTQLLEQETAARALSDATGAPNDATTEMQGSDATSATARMAVDDDAFAQATEARYVGEAETDEMEAMPGLDLDLDLPGTSMILESSGEALSEALGEDFEIEVDSPPRKKRA